MPYNRWIWTNWENLYRETAEILELAIIDRKDENMHEIIKKANILWKCVDFDPKLNKYALILFKTSTNVRNIQKYANVYFRLLWSEIATTVPIFGPKTVFHTKYLKFGDFQSNSKAIIRPNDCDYECTFVNFL